MRLIDAHRLHNVLYEVYEKNRNDGKGYICEFMTKQIEPFIFAAPTIEAEPVRHGQWVEMERGHYFKCSKCRNPIPYKFGWKLYNGVISNKRYYNYCPNCGARMDEVSE